ncbi:AAA family ATPase [Photobacterium sp. TY1-4]|uniref:AAA family ATPase n=1 Tax=Photobacterium sp. TY1-4 TaxID=2899122 RepID=UPI0021C18F9C|nr:AAA family ATPase [Photobacterium sp. TY1-4]UXI02376.1 AAA family ATPase [Photobacterium sp. TY1-4]
MNKILIIGNSGSGKSWLSVRLSNQLQYPEVNLDAVVWEPGGFHQKRPQEVIDGELTRLSQETHWVVEGVFGALAEQLIDSADTLLFLDMDWELCEQSLLSRGSESSKQLDQGLAEKNFQDLLVWASAYYHRQSKNSRTFHHRLYAEFGGRKRHFTRREDVVVFLNTDVAALAE